MTTATKAQSTKLSLAPNMPVVMDIRYVDVYPQKTVGAQVYGAQVSLKGVIDGASTIIYLPGKPWANLKALMLAGVIGEYDSSIEDPPEKVNVPVLNGSSVTLCRRQLAGERFATLVVETDGVPSREPGKPSQPSRTGTAKQAVEDYEVGDLPDEPPPVEEAFRETAKRPAPAAGKLAALFAVYDACWDHAVALAEQHIDLEPDVSAIAATLYISAKDRGITV